MRRVRVGTASLNTTVGAFITNTDKLIFAAEEMDRRSCHLGIFQEMAIPGYPCEDLVQWETFLEGQMVQLCRFAEATKDLLPVFVVGMALSHEQQVYNVAAIVSRGEIQWFVPKESLPTYNVFYDGRTFTPGLPGAVDEGAKFGDAIFQADFGRFGVVVCEDIWRSDGPVPRRARDGAEIIVNISASPWRDGVIGTRRNMLRTRSSDNQAAMVYVNAFGGNDSLVFDGGTIFAMNGDILYETPRMCEAVDSFSFDMDEVRRGRTQNTTWRTDVRQHHQENRESKVVSVPSAPADAEPRGRDDMPLVLSGEPFADDFFDPDALESEETLRIDEMIEAILVGLDGYFRKTGAFRGIAVAASGGRDSVLSTLLAWLWSERQDPKVPIFCYSMPTRHNSNETKGLAARFSKILRTSFSEDPIQEQFEAEVVQVKRIAKVSELPPITVQNIQARIRGSRMWNLSNALGLLWLQSGNMTERATGYTTLGGDLMGGYSLIGNLEKTRVNEMLERIQRVTQDGVPKLWDAISDLMNSVASAELADDQQDERDLMPYPVLDEGLKLFVGERKSPRDVLRILREREGAIRRNCPGYDPAKLAGWVEKTVRLFFRNIFKLVQSPQAVHLQGAVDLDRERALQLPAVMSTEWIDFNLGDE